MIFISHRGNIEGPESKYENKPSYIFNALNMGFQVEVDVWYDNGWWYGHDKPQYKANKKDFFLFWCHAKNSEAFARMRLLKTDCFFWHQEDDYTLTSNGYIWTYPGKTLVKGSIAVMPEVSYKGNLKKCSGICSDNINFYKKRFGN